MRTHLFILAASLFVLAAYPMRAEEAGSRRPFGGKAHTIPGKIETEHYDEGKPGEAYHDLDEKNHGADYRGAHASRYRKTRRCLRRPWDWLDQGGRVGCL